MTNQIASTHADITAGVRTILVAEDDPLVRRFIRSVLGKAGFQIIEASDGIEAKELIESHRGSIALAICDIRMPRENGLDLAVRSILLKDPAAILTKPFTAGALIERVQTLIGSAGAPIPARGADALKKGPGKEEAQPPQLRRHRN